MVPAPLIAGTCGGCSAALAPGQRYCLACGERRGELAAPFQPPERAVPAATVPGRRSFGAVGTIVLASGVLIGAAIGPALTPASLAATAGQLVVVATDPGSATTTSAQPAPGSTASSSSTLSAPTGNVAAPHHVVRAAAPAPPAASAASAPSAPAAPSTPAPTTTPTTPTTTPPVVDPSVAGTVVHVSHAGKRYVLATKEGQLIVVATKHAPALGEELKTTVRARADGTFKELKPTSKGHAETANFHGTVTYADPVAQVYTVSARGVSLLVTMPPPADPAQPPPPPPAVGTLVTVEVAITDKIRETKRVDGDPAAGEIDLEAIVREPDPANPDPTKLIVSADDAGESPATLSLTVPPKLDVSKLTPGTVVAATVKREADGSLTLVTVSPDA